MFIIGFQRHGENTIIVAVVVKFVCLSLFSSEVGSQGRKNRRFRVIDAVGEATNFSLYIHQVTIKVIVFSVGHFPSVAVNCGSQAP